MTMAYHRFHALDTRIVRIFNTYGSRMRPNDGRVVSNFIVQALHGQPLTIYGDGSQTRSFCYVDDLIEGIVRVFERGTPDPINLGNPHEFTVRQLADHVLATFDRDEAEEVERMTLRGADAAETFITSGIETVMNQYNGGDPATTE